MHALGQLRCCVFLFVCYRGSCPVLSQWGNAFLEVRTTRYPAFYVWGEPTLALISEPIKLNVAIRLYADSHAGAVARAIAVVALLFCYLKGSQAAPPIVAGLYSAFLARNESSSSRGMSNRPQSEIGFIRAA